MNKNNIFSGLDIIIDVIPVYFISGDEKNPDWLLIRYCPYYFFNLEDSMKVNIDEDKEILLFRKLGDDYTFMKNKVNFLRLVKRISHLKSKTESLKKHTSRYIALTEKISEHETWEVKFCKWFLDNEYDIPQIEPKNPEVFGSTTSEKSSKGFNKGTQNRDIPQKYKSVKYNHMSFDQKTDIWDIYYNYKNYSIKNHLGLKYIACILKYSGENEDKGISTLEIYDKFKDSINTNPSYSGLDEEVIIKEEKLNIHLTEQGIEAIDKIELKRLYDEIEDLNSQIDEAEKNNEYDKVAKLKETKQLYYEEINSLTDFHGRPKKINDELQNKIKSVNTAIKREIEKLENSCPDLANNLGNDGIYLKGQNFYYKHYLTNKWNISF